MPLRLIFMGTPDFAVPTLLELLAHGHDIARDREERAVHDEPNPAWSSATRSLNCPPARFGSDMAILAELPSAGSDT